MNSKSTLKVLFFVALSFWTSSSINAQEKNWKTLQNEAQAFEKANDYLRAAAYYELAFNDNTTKPELAFKAGECFLRVRDYKNAAKNLDFVKNETAKETNMAGFLYALALKQNGSYELAKKAFTAFLAIYNGSDKETLKLKVDNEIKGCDFATAAVNNVDKNISFVHLSPSVNTERNETAVLPYSGKVYFNSDISGDSKLYNAQKIGDTWSSRKNADVDNNPAGENFQGGSYTPDGKRYYFAQLVSNENGTKSSAIFVSEKNDASWSEPQKLPGFINELTSNNKNPSVINDKGQEIIYFSSDRTGGKGGFDIWYTSLSIKDGVKNYTLPKNVGGIINTVADEITPFYDIKTTTLYYSSNGNVNMGGFDVFRVKGAKTQWETVKNLGLPVNSAADDYFYILDKVEGGGYLVSNRLHDNEQLTTTNDDIYYFEERQIKMTIKGQIFDAVNRKESNFKNLSVKLYALSKDKKELIQEIKPEATEYKVVLNADKNYMVVINADGFIQFAFEQTTVGMMQDEIRVNDILMQKIGSDDVSLLDLDAKTDPYYIIVPQEYNTPDKTYKLPLKPVDAKSGNEVKKGTYAYFAFVEADIIAKKATERKVYWNESGVLTAFVQGKSNSKQNSSSVNPNQTTSNNNTSITANSDKNKTDNNTTNTSNTSNTSNSSPKETSGANLKYFMIQIAAVKNYNISNFKQIRGSKFSKCELATEKTEKNLTRVFLVPSSLNEDGTKGFKNKADLSDYLNYIKTKTSFKDAFIVEK